MHVHNNQYKMLNNIITYIKVKIAYKLSLKNIIIPFRKFFVESWVHNSFHKISSFFKLIV